MFRDKIRNAYDGLSPSFRVVANFLLDSTYEAAFLNTSQLARRLDVDPATVVRFAQHLGYKGYPHLLTDVQAEVKEDLDRYLSPPPLGKDAGSVALAAVRREIHNLELLERALQSKDVKRFVDLALKAGKIVIVGEGAGRELARLFAYKLRELGLNAYDADLSPEATATAFVNLRRGDLVVGLATSPRSQDTRDVLRLASQRKATVVAVAGAAVGKDAIPAHLTLFTPNETALGAHDDAALGTLLSALFQALWIASQERQVRLARPFSAYLETLTELRHKAKTPAAPEIMKQKPADK